MILLDQSKLIVFLIAQFIHFPQCSLHSGNIHHPMSKAISGSLSFRASVSWITHAVFSPDRWTLTTPDIHLPTGGLTAYASVGIT